MEDLIVEKLDTLLREFSNISTYVQHSIRDSSGDIQLHSRRSEKQVLAYR